MKILVMRLSAMGDVAMLLPVLYAVAKANPQHEFTLLTQPFLANLLLSPPSNVEAMVIETKGEERNFWGLFRYAHRLREEGFDICLDLHDVLRTKFLRSLLYFGGVKVHSLYKDRVARARLLRPEGEKDLSPLKAMYEAYRGVFAVAGLVADVELSPINIDPRIYTIALQEQCPEVFAGQVVVGIAPFASTDSKTYDLAYMEQVVSALSQEGQVVYLFGGRGQEAELLQTWANKYGGVRSLAGCLDLAEELAIIARLGLMLSMDSANMHFASLVGVPVLSLWCGTHPSAGFLGVGQSLGDCLQDEALSCRPCSIFGKVKSCIKGDMPCRRSLRPMYVVQRVQDKLSALKATKMAL